MREICTETGKICYSEREAGTILNCSKKAHNKSNHKKKLTRKYRCNACGTWHLTSMPFITDDVKEAYKRQQRIKAY
jgi:hypothetical protein